MRRRASTDVELTKTAHRLMEEERDYMKRCFDDIEEQVDADELSAMINTMHKGRRHHPRRTEIRAVYLLSVSFISSCILESIRLQSLSVFVLLIECLA